MCGTWCTYLCTINKQTHEYVRLYTVIIASVMTYVFKIHHNSQ